MPVSKRQILECLATVEQRAPIDFGDMPVAEDTVRDIFASAAAALHASSDFRRASPARREASLLASLTHVMLEAACLRYQLQASAQSAAAATDHLLARVATA